MKLSTEIRFKSRECGTYFRADVFGSLKVHALIPAFPNYVSQGLRTYAPGFRSSIAMLPVFR
jgi:hypothetical protein